MFLTRSWWIVQRSSTLLVHMEHGLEKALAFTSVPENLDPLDVNSSPVMQPEFLQQNPLFFLPSSTTGPPPLPLSLLDLYPSWGSWTLCFARVMLGKVVNVRVYLFVSVKGPVVLFQLLLPPPLSSSVPDIQLSRALQHERSHGVI